MDMHFGIRHHRTSLTIMYGTGAFLGLHTQTALRFGGENHQTTRATASGKNPLEAVADDAIAASSVHTQVAKGK